MVYDEELLAGDLSLNDMFWSILRLVERPQIAQVLN